ncbi:ketosamine-3-kinase-like isoform X2 [Palaemon carinicauda]|uniref:ketosamine-3-kinase-like isoform X2 n=1 Tax=Palaemon carinicauda TaxID=392227 RepID=UPI0035B5B6B7
MTSKMYDAILEALGTSRFVATGQVGGRCINEGEVDHGKDITVKTSNSRQARAMFDGEFESPKATKLTGTVRVPTPHIVVDDPAGGVVLCGEYPDMAQFESAHGNAWEAAGRMFCREGEENAAAAIWFQTPEESVRSLFHEGSDFFIHYQDQHKFTRIGKLVPHRDSSVKFTVSCSRGSSHQNEAWL